MREKLRTIIRAADVVYTALYDGICGKHPGVHPWHFQWLALRELNRDVRAVLPTLEGRVLDLGCGQQPYRNHLSAAEAYVGCDIADAPGVDVVISPGERLPFEDGAFDAVFSSQVFEHIADLGFTIGEIRRVLKAGGALVVSVPFMFQLHGAPHDYRRLSEFGAAQTLEGFRVTELRREGAIGSTLSVLLLGWINVQMNANVLTWGLKALLLPLWVPFCLAVNLAGLLLDLLDGTDSFYHNVLLVARKN